MSSQSKILIGLGAVLAFVIGFTINKVQTNNDIDASTLLTAQLIVGDSVVTTPAEDSQSATPIEGSVSFATVEDSLGELTLVNFWASWCTPCREEMPVFETMYLAANSAGFVVIGIAIDTPDKAQPMLDSMGITYPILYAQETGIEIMESAGNSNGLLPYSLLLDKNGKVIEQVLGQIHEQQIADWISEHL